MILLFKLTAERRRALNLATKAEISRKRITILADVTAKYSVKIQIIIK